MERLRAVSNSDMVVANGVIDYRCLSASANAAIALPLLLFQTVDFTDVSAGLFLCICF